MPVMLSHVWQALKDGSGFLLDLAGTFAQMPDPSLAAEAV